MKLNLTELKTIVNKRKGIFGLFLGLTVLALVLSFSAYRPKTTQIIQTIPSNNTPNVEVKAPIIIKFSRPLSTDEIVHIALQPPAPGNVNYNSDRTQATFEPFFNYKTGTQYTVAITGTEFADYNFNFSTFSPQGSQFSGIPTPNLAPGSGMQKFISTLPYRNEQFTIDHLATSNLIIITITQLPYETNKQAALDYIKSFGFENPQLEFNISIDSAPEFRPRTPEEASAPPIIH